MESDLQWVEALREPAIFGSNKSNFLFHVVLVDGKSKSNAVYVNKSSFVGVTRGSVKQKLNIFSHCCFWYREESSLWL